MAAKSWDLTVPAPNRLKAAIPGDIRDVKEHVQIIGFYAEAQSTPDQTIAIYEGVAYFGTTKVEYAGLAVADLGTSGAFEVSALTADYYNKILFTIDSSGTLAIIEGTEHAVLGSVVEPAIPAGKFPICMVAVQDDGTGTAGTILTIEQSEITQLQGFASVVGASDTAYGASWDGVTAIAPSKNAVYDKIVAIDAKNNQQDMNILIANFRIAVLGSKVKYNLVDGITDAFVDESGVDTGASTNQTYDAVNNLYSPNLATTTWSETLTTDDTTYADYTVRQICAAASISASGTMVRVTIPTHAAGEGLYIDNVAIVERDPGTSNGITTPTEILFSGGSGISLAAGDTGVSDFTAFTLDETKDYLLIADFSANTSNDSIRFAPSGDGAYQKAGTNSYDTQNLVSPFYTAGYTRLFSLLEVQNVDGMSLQSLSTEAVSIPSTARIVLIEEDVDSVTLNTDLKAYASRTDGNEWTQATLAEEMALATGRVLSGTADVSSQTSDKTMKWLVTTHNGKDLKVHYLGELYG